MRNFHPFILALALVFTLSNCSSAEQIKDQIQPEEEIFYHVFQRSFYDSNGDGHGDLNGFTQKLDYLEELGVTSILMTPLYESIYYHNYFADDFKAIDQEFGSLEDYLEMVTAIHEKGMKYYMDMEVHYITENHIWFSDSYRQPDSKYSEYVIYNGEGNTNPESSIFNLTSLESYNGDEIRITTIDLYNEGVKTYIYDLFKYWVDPNKDGNFEDGVDGFRIDHMMDDLDYKGILPNLLSDFWAPLIKELKAINPNIRIMAEQADWTDLGSSYFEKSDIDYVFGFEIRNAITSFTKANVVAKMDTTIRVTPADKHQLIFLENHDINRFASVVDSHPGKLRLAAAITLLSKGIPLIYYGQELGMRGDGGFGRFGVSDGNDIPRREAFEWYAAINGPGMALWYKDSGPWWDETNLSDYDGISYEEQADDPNSLLSFYKDIISFRKATPAITFGSQKFIENESDGIITMLRKHEEKLYLIAFNMDEGPQSVSILKNEVSEQALFGSTALSDGFSALSDEGNDFLISMNGFGYAVWELSNSTTK